MSENENISTEGNSFRTLTNNISNWLEENTVIVICVGSAAIGLIILLTGVICHFRKKALKKEAVQELQLKPTTSINSSSSYLPRSSSDASELYASFKTDLEEGSRFTMDLAKESISNLPSFEDIDGHAEKVLDSAKQFFDSMTSSAPTKTDS